MSATVPAGDKLFDRKPAQLVAGGDWRATPAKAKNTKIMVAVTPKSRIVAFPFKLCFAVGGRRLSDAPVISGRTAAPVSGLVGDKGAQKRPCPDLEPVEKSDHDAISTMEMEANMPLSGSADPGELAILTAVLEDYCRKHKIEPKTPEWYATGRRLMIIHSQGAASPVNCWRSSNDNSFESDPGRSLEAAIGITPIPPSGF